MSIFASLAKTKLRDAHDNAVKLIAKWDPEGASEAQIEEWEGEARKVAQMAATASADARKANDRLNQIQNDLSRYTSAAENLSAAGNNAAANEAADKALELKDQLTEAQSEVTETASWAKETLEAANAAQKKVVEGKTKLDKARRDQARAKQHEQVSESRLSDRQRLAGITHGASGVDAALDAMVANTEASKTRAEANDIRSKALGETVETNSDVQAALAEVDGKNKPQTFAEKMAALKK